MSESVRNSALRQEITARLGTCPGLFLLNENSPGQARSLWDHACFAFFDNPIPSLFKQQLVTYLGRFCRRKYCVSRHAAFLAGFGFPAGDPDCPPISVEQVIELLNRPTPDQVTLDWHLDKLRQFTPVEDWPSQDSPLENHVFVCSIPLFLQLGNERRCRGELKRVLGTVWYDWLSSLLAFVHMAHFWIEIHDFDQLDADVLQFVTHNPGFKNWLRSYSEVVELESAQGFAWELDGRETAQIPPEPSATSIVNNIMGNQALVEAILTGVPDAMVLTDLDRRLIYCNPGVKRIFGYEPDELVGQLSSVLYAFQRDYEYQNLNRFNARATADFEPYEVTWKRRNGDLFQGESVGTIILDPHGKPLGFLKLVRDVSERKRNDERQFRRTRVLEAVSSGASLSDVLSLVIELSEKARPGMTGSILLLDDQTGRLRNASRNSLPDEFNSAVEGLAVGTDGFPFVVSARQGSRVIAENLQSDPAWGPLCKLAGPAGLRACWAEPVLAPDRTVLGALVMYFRRPQVPSPRDLELLRDCAQLAAIAIERARALELLRKSEQRFDLAVRGSADGIWDWSDPSSEQIWFSPRMFELLGYHPDEVESDVSFVSSMIHPRELEPLKAQVNSLLEDDQLLELELQLKVKSGDYRWFRVRALALKDEQGMPVRFTGSLEDIHHRVVAQRDATVLGGILEDSVTAIYVIDYLSRHVVYANRIGRQQLGYTTPELNQINAVELLVGTSKSDFNESIDRLHDQQIPSLVAEQRMRRQDGSMFDVEIHAQLASFRGRESIVLFVVDITERKVAEEEKKELQRYILNATAEEQRRIGHDLHDGVGQELTGLVMLADTMTMVLEQAEHAQAGLARKIGEITESALEQVRMLARGLNPIQIESEGLATALAELASYVEELYEVECVFEGQQVVRLNDSETATQLFRIAQEATTNAVKHGNADRIQIRLSGNNHRVTMQIHDNGVGIALDNPSVEGTGMRSMSYRADLVGASLEIERHPKVGTIVTCELEQNS